MRHNMAGVTKPAPNNVQHAVTVEITHRHRHSPTTHTIVPVGTRLHCNTVASRPVLLCETEWTVLWTGDAKQKKLDNDC